MVKGGQGEGRRDWLEFAELKGERRTFLIAYASRCRLSGVILLPGETFRGKERLGCEKWSWNIGAIPIPMHWILRKICLSCEALELGLS